MKKFLFVLFLLCVPSFLSAQTTILYAPQLAVGCESPAGPCWTTTVAFQNVVGTPTTVLWDWFDSTGTGMRLDFTTFGGGQTSKSVGGGIFSPVAGGSRFDLSTDGPVKVGFIKFQISGPMPLISVTYRRVDNDGAVLSSVAVSLVAPMTTWYVIAKSSDKEDLGVAVVSPQNLDVEVTFEVFGDFRRGAPYATVKKILPAGQYSWQQGRHLALFLGELFPNLPEDDGGGNRVTSGFLKISAKVPIAVTAVQGITSVPGQFLMSGVPVVAAPP